MRTEVHVATPGLSLFRDEPGAGWALPPHRHGHEAETIHVLAGRFWSELDGVRSELGPGETVHVPAGTLHAGGTLGEGPWRRLVAFTPGGMERLFRALDGLEDPADALRLALAAGWRFG